MRSQVFLMFWPHISSKHSVTVWVGRAVALGVPNKMASELNTKCKSYWGGSGQINSEPLHTGIQELAWVSVVYSDLCALRFDPLLNDDF